MTSLRRVKFRKGLSQLYLPFYDALCELLPEAWDPYQGWRSFAYQDTLFTQGRTAPGPGAIPGVSLGGTVTNARGGESPHQYGCATDWIIFEDGAPVWLKESDPRWDEYYQACEKVGVRSGAPFGDRPHNELMISKSWKRDVYPVYQKSGAAKTEVFIKECLLK